MASTKSSKPAAKTTKSTPSSRRDKLASFEAARKKEQRRRTITLLVVCVVLAAAVLAVPIYYVWEDAKARNATIGELGASLADAGCDPAAENAASGNQDHVAVGTQVDYPQHPPDSGAHYDTPAAFARHFYTSADRPAVETLVHNLEHGYTIAWYRDTASAEQISTLESIAKTFSSDDYDPADKFIAAPWSEADGSGFPAGKDVVLARWTADPNNPTDVAAQRGVRQACTLVSGPAVADFMAKYPVANSPEPNGA